MGYQSYLIAKYATALDKSLQPWLLPDDAQETLYDGYIYKGVMNKRPGYQPYATGQRGSAPYCESRMVNRITSEAARDSIGTLVVGDGTVGPYTFRIQNTPVRRGTVSIVAGAQTVVDDGLGGFTGTTGSINYTTGDVTVTFPLVVAGAVQIFVTYDYHSGLPGMAVMNFVTVTNAKILITADTKRLNIYNTSTNRVDYLGRTMVITGITNANPGVVTSVAHGLTTGDKIFIYDVLGMTQVDNLEFTVLVITADTFSIGVDTTAYTAYSSGGIAQLIFSGTNKNFFSWVNYADDNGNPRLLFSNNKDEVGYYAPQLTPTVGDYINYTGFAMDDDAGNPVTSITALLLFTNKDRLLMLRTTESGVVKPTRIRISGTGGSSDDFTTTATGAGFIDIPDGSWIMGAAFNRDDLIIFTENSTWVLKYTGNDTVPFIIQKIDESRGSQAPYAAITYLNRTSALSTRGMIISDGYRVERMDESLPEFSFNEIDGENFDLCFAGSVDEDRDHYLIYPPPNFSKSDRVLVTNYEEDNFGIYRFALSCMGTYLQQFDITWADLRIYPNWAAFASAYGDWNHFSFTKGNPLAIGLGHFGEIWQLAVNEVEDNPQKIRNITVIDANTIQVTTDWNNYSLNALDQEKGADTIFFTGVLGMLEVNNKQYPIIAVTDNYTFRVKVPSTTGFSAYTSGGVASRVIPFTATFKKFNPFVNMDKKVRCGWIYFYVSASGTSLSRNIKMVGASNTNPCVIETNIAHNLQSGDEISIFGVGGMTEINTKSFFVTVLTSTTFALNGIDATGYGVYTSGGYATSAEKCRIQIDIITNDTEEKIQVNNVTQNPIQCNATNLVFEEGIKKWYKSYINLTGRFIQFRVRNLQAGAKIQIHAVMPGFQPVGRMV